MYAYMYIRISRSRVLKINRERGNFLNVSAHICRCVRTYVHRHVPDTMSQGRIQGYNMIILRSVINIINKGHAKDHLPM